MNLKQIASEAIKKTVQKTYQIQTESRPASGCICRVLSLHRQRTGSAAAGKDEKCAAGSKAGGV